ncbi:beta-galactosidase [Yeosuana aromativorans]|uniref:Beta-galactosidase n=2 Tax=Yeosuana aromativorans TaxID=288019 RepID=A0A8J3BCS8_9FLAO|nr:beta-galactosidase [Yeosuana aromativorans]
MFAQSKVPYLTKHGRATQLVVNGQPYLMIAGELHNSSASTTEYMKPLFPKLKAMNLNTVFVSVAWEQFEPKEGVFDYTLVNAIIDNAKENHLKVCLLWFASWKNGESSYAPMWVKKDTKRFFRVKTKEGKAIETLSPFCEATKIADAKAFTQLMKHIKEYDTDQTVILMQPENEVGMFQDIDYNKVALDLFEKEVPKALMTYLKENKKQLDTYVSNAWSKSNFKTSGTWKEIFGDTPEAKAFFTTWQYATYINFVAKSGRGQYNLPMMVNAWIVQKPDDLPGVYPNGGPVSRVMDIWKAAAPNIDVQSPDIYLPNFKEIVARYHRDDNPLLIPESTAQMGRAYYAFGAHDAICFSPFGIEDASDDFVFKKAYGVLNEIQHYILKYQGTGNMKAVLKEGNETYEDLYMGDYKIKVMYEKPNEPSFGIVIQTDANEFLIIGMNLSVYFYSEKRDTTAYIGQVFEGRFENGAWVTTRMLNGDETFHNSRLRVFGRLFESSKGIDQINKKEGDPDAYSPSKMQKTITPGIYKVITYER